MNLLVRPESSVLLASNALPTLPLVALLRIIVVKQHSKAFSMFGVCLAYPNRDNAVARPQSGEPGKNNAFRPGLDAQRHHVWTDTTTVPGPRVAAMVENSFMNAILQN